MRGHLAASLDRPNPRPPWDPRLPEGPTAVLRLFLYNIFHLSLRALDRVRESFEGTWLLRSIAKSPPARRPWCPRPATGFSTLRVDKSKGRGIVQSLCTSKSCIESHLKLARCVWLTWLGSVAKVIGSQLHAEPPLCQGTATCRSTIVSHLRTL